MLWDSLAEPCRSVAATHAEHTHPPQKTPLQVAMLQRRRCSTSPSRNKLRGAFISGGFPGLAQRN